MENKFTWAKPPTDNHTTINSGDIRLVNLNVECIFEWSDEIVADYDAETGYTEYTSGFVMKVLPNQNFVYKGENTLFIANATKEEQNGK